MTYVPNMIHICPNIYIYIYIYICLVEGKLEGKQGMEKVGRTRKFLYFFGEKWNKGTENAEFSIEPTFSFPLKLEGNREKRVSVLEHKDCFFLSILPCKPNTSNARYSHFLFLLFVSTLDFPPPPLPFSEH